MRLQLQLPLPLSAFVSFAYVLAECVRSAGSLDQVNRMLRDQLDQATSANAALTSDVQRLSLELQRTRDELDAREAEWRREEQVFNDYYTTEHARLLALWRQVVAFRRQFSGARRAPFRPDQSLFLLRSALVPLSDPLVALCL